MIEIPGLGRFTLDEDLDWYCGETRIFRVLGGIQGRLILSGYDDSETDRSEYLATATAFLSADPSILKTAERAIYDYYKATLTHLDADELPPRIESPSDVWDHVTLGTKPMLQRGKDGVHVSLECECSWDPEHGLMLVFERGRRISKVGPYDGHLE